LICGSKTLDFKELESVTRYQDYTAESAVVGWLWETVHSFEQT